MPLKGRPLELLLEGLGSFFITYFFAVGTSASATNAGVSSSKANYLALTFVATGLIYLSNQVGYPTCFNPAITFTQYLRGKLGEGIKDWKTLLIYWGVQFACALPAAIMGYATRPDDNIVGCVAKGKYYNIVQAFMNEWLWSTMFCYVFIVMFFEKELQGNAIYGLVVGLVYLVIGSSAVISGGGYNPAMSFGLWFSSSFMKPDGNDCFKNGWGYLWYFLLGPLAGSATAWGLHKLLNDDRFAKFHQYGMEFVGTFFITMTACFTIVNGTAFEVGTCIALFTYIGAYKQSGYYNPVYTIMAYVNGGLTLVKFGLFSAAQCAGSFTAAVVAYLMTRYGSGDGQDFLDAGGQEPVPYRPRAANNVNKFGALLAEFFATFFVAVMYMATTARVHKTGRRNNPLYGLIIGWTVSAASLTVGAYTYSYFNPALWVGSSFVYLFAEGGDDFGEIYIYAIAGFGGAAAASFFYKYVVGEAYDGPGHDSEEGRSVREREDMRTAAQIRRGKSASASSGSALAVDSGAGAGSAPKASASSAAAPTDDKV